MSERLFVEDDGSALDPALLYDVFAQFSIPPGTVIFQLTDVLTGAVQVLPAPIFHTYRALIRIAVDRLSLNPTAYVVECWSNRTFEVGLRVDYHIDNDENLRQKTGRLSVPTWGAIYHAGPSALEVGGTWFDPPPVDPLREDRLFASPLFADVISPAGRLVTFRPGRFVMFDGRCPHCVVPFGSLPTPRVTILFNFWPKERLPRTSDTIEQ